MGVKIPYGSPKVTYLGRQKYVMNPEWVPFSLDIPEGTASILFAVFPNRENIFDCKVDTTGHLDYTITDTEGNSYTYGGGTSYTRTITYDFDTVSSATTSLGYKTVKITLTGDITYLLLNVSSNGYDNYLGIIINFINFNKMQPLNYFNNMNSDYDWYRNFEIFVIKHNNITSCAAQFIVYGTSIIAIESRIKYSVQDTFNVTDFSNQFAIGISNSYGAVVDMQAYSNDFQNTSKGINFSGQFSAAPYYGGPAIFLNLFEITQDTSKGVNFQNQFGITNQSVRNYVNYDSLTKIIQDERSGTNYSYQFGMNSTETLTYYVLFPKLLDLELTLNPSVTSSSAFTGFMTAHMESLKKVRFINPDPVNYPNFCTGLRTLYFESTKLDRAALIQLFNDLPNLTAVSATGNLYLAGTAGNADLLDEDKLIATNKGFTLHL